MFGEGQWKVVGVVGLCLRPQERAEDYLDQGGMHGWHLDKDSWFRTVLQMGYPSRSGDQTVICFHTVCGREGREIYIHFPRNI